MPEPQPSRARQLLGDFAPKMASLTDDVVFGDIWERAELSPRDRSWSRSPRSSRPAAPSTYPATSPEHKQTA